MDNRSSSWGCAFLILIAIVCMMVMSQGPRRARVRHVVHRPAHTSVHRTARPQVGVGVARTRVETKIDLTDKLNPAILPDVLKEVLRELTPGQKPESEKFQQEVVQKLSQKIMDDPEVNYRVDLNEDANLDPVLVVPEAVEGEAAVYSVRVPDPGKNPKDPGTQADWGKLADEGLELMALSVTFDQNTKQMVIDAEPNEYLYEGSGRQHYRSEYHSHHHNWMDTYFKYMIFRSVLFGPYSWYGPRWYGGWYGGYYGGWHAPVRTRTVTRRVTRYKTSPTSRTGMKTASGKGVRSSKASARKTMPKSIQSMKSKRAMQARSKTAGVRSGGFGKSSSSRSTSSSRRSSSRRTSYGSRSSSRRRSVRSSGFRGRSSGWGK